MMFERGLVARWIAGHGWTLPLLIAVIVGAAPLLGLNFEWQINVEEIGIYTLIASGVNLSFGYGGELAFGQVAIFAVGAYATAILSSHNVTDLLIVIIVSAICAMVVSAVTGTPGLRLSAWSLGIVSFFTILLVPSVVEIFSGATGGYVGLSGIIDPTLVTVQLGAHAYYIFIIVIVTLWMFGFRNLILSRYGLALRSLSVSPRLAESLGVRTLRLRIVTYMIGGVPAGVAGCLFAYVVTYVEPSIFSFDLAIAVLASSIVGGASSIWGAPIGAALLVLGPLQAASFARYSLFVYGFFLLLVGVLFRGGIAGLGRRLSARPLARFRQAAVPAGPASLGEYESMGAGSLPGSRLVVRGVTKSFGGIRAIDGVDLEAAPGFITAIIGANGAGKTTLLNAISGMISVDAGSLRCDDVELAGLSASAVAANGVSRTFQTPLIPQQLSVCDVVKSGRLCRSGLGVFSAVLRLPGYRRLDRDATREALGLLSLAGLADAAEQEAAKLPLGSRRMTEVLRAAVANPRVLLLDEPAAGLDDAALDDLRRLLIVLREAGLTVILVEHNVSFVMQLADWVHVMHLGKVICSGPPDVVRRDPEVIASYLGAEVAIEQGGESAAVPADEIRDGRNPERLSP
jgi:branched-chain amino acid transport system permease protein